MPPFELHPQLANDSVLITKKCQCEVRLIRQSLVNWLIVVPHTQQTEWIYLEAAIKTEVQACQDNISRVMLEELEADKLNTALIGNLVEQMHLHIIARRRDDAFWPKVVWGESLKDYTAHDLQRQIEFWQGKL